MKRALQMAVAALLVAAGTAAEEKAAPFTVTVDWLAEHLNDPGMVILHVGDQAEYEAEHIPGAQFVTRQEISTPANSQPVLELPPVEQLQAAFESLGVSDDSRIIVYFGKDWITPAARVILTLDYLGLGPQTSMLDGGMPAWRASGRPLSSGKSATKPLGSLKPAVRNDVVVDAAWVQARLKQPEVALVDARTPNFYKGESAGSAARAGHIPGAVNIPFSSVIDESLRIKDKKALESLFAEAGVKRGQTVVTYCHIGQQASLLYLVSRYLGYDTRLYDGSFTEWSSKPDLPVEKTP